MAWNSSRLDDLINELRFAESAWLGGADLIAEDSLASGMPYAQDANQRLQDIFDAARASEYGAYANPLSIQRSMLGRANWSSTALDDVLRTLLRGTETGGATFNPFATLSSVGGDSENALRFASDEYLNELRARREWLANTPGLEAQYGADYQQNARDALADLDAMEEAYRNRAENSMADYLYDVFNTEQMAPYRREALNRWRDYITNTEDASLYGTVASQDVFDALGLSDFGLNYDPSFGGAPATQQTPQTQQPFDPAMRGMQGFPAKGGYGGYGGYGNYGNYGNYGGYGGYGQGMNQPPQGQPMGYQPMQGKGGYQQPQGKGGYQQPQGKGGTQNYPQGKGGGY